LGGEEKPTTIKGTWKDKFIRPTTDSGAPVTPSGVALYNGSQVADVFQLTQAVDGIRLAGRLLEVKWDRHVRHGILTRFRQSWIRPEDVEWEMEFQWTSRGEVQTPVTLPLQPDAEDFSIQLTDSRKTLSAAVDDHEFQVNGDFLTEVTALLDQIDDAAIEAQNAAQASISQVMSPVDAAERALTAAESARLAAVAIVGAVESLPPAELLNSEDPAELGLGEVLAAASYGRAVKDAARAVATICSAQADTMRAIVREDQLIGSFTARAPTDLRDVSTQYYGTPNEWRRLMLYNDLASSALDAGTVVLVPKLSFADRGT
jgi:hypothetical protein